MIPSINWRIISCYITISVKRHKTYLRIMWPTGKWCWMGQTRLSWTNIHVCLLHKSPEYQFRIPVLGNCSKHQFKCDAHAWSCQSFRFSYKKTVLHMKGLRMLCSGQLCLCSKETQKCHRYVDMPYLYCTNSNLHYTNYKVNYNIYSNAWWGNFPYKVLNQTMQSQSKVCIAKSPYASCAPVRYKAACSDNSLLTFWDNLKAPSSRVNKSKRTEHDSS